MAIKLFELGFIFRAIDKMTGTLASVQRHIEGVNAAAKKGAAVREFSENLGLMGAGALAASAAIALPLKDAVSGYEELQNHVARVGAALGSATDKAQQLGAMEEFVKKQAVATGYSMTDMTESVYQGISGFLKMDQAMAVSAQAAKVARATQGDLAATTNTLATMMLNFSDKTKSPIQNAQILSDKLVAIQTQGKFTTITDLQYALKESAPAMNAFGVSLNQGLGALAAFSAAGLDSSNAGTAFLEIMGQMNKAAGKIGFKVLTNPQGGMDLLATVEEIKQKFGGMSRNDFGRLMVGGFGLRAGPRLVDLMDKMDQFRQATDIAAKSAGATDQAFSEFQKRGTLASSQLQQALDVLKDDVGGALAPAVEGVTRRLMAFAQAIEPLVSAHPKLVKIVTEFAAWTAVALGTLGAIALLGASLGFIASYVPLVGSLVGVFKLLKGAEDAAALAHFGLPTGGWGSLVTGIRAASVALVGYASALWSGVAAGAAFLVTNPIGWAILAVAAVGALIYAIYRYRDSIGAALSFVGTEFSKLGNLAFDWGVNLLKKFGDGIASAVMWPVHAIENVVGKMARFVVGHSPIPQGPLHDLNLGRDLARTIQPAPAVSAIRRFATTVALAAPMMVAVQAPAIAARATMDASTPAMTAMRAAQPAVASAVRVAAAATPIIAPPAMVRMNAPARALASPGRSEGAEGKSSGVTVTIDYRPNVTVHVSGRADSNVTKRVVLDAIKDGGGELLRLVEEAMRRRSRTEF